MIRMSTASAWPPRDEAGRGSAVRQDCDHEKPADAERVSGYKIGGVSPFGQLRRIPVVIDETALLWDAIFLNGGQRELQVEVTGEDVARVLSAVIADVSATSR
jgi:prolyl-tRNA editing enzyme YbaK/EbsC (Cys-tRNA(Pro) deacylase)